MFNYSELVIDHFENPRNVGSFPKEIPHFSSKIGSRISGIVLELHITTHNQLIVEARFKAYGCVATIAMGSWIAEWVAGKTFAEALSLTSDDLMQVLNLPMLKRHITIIGLEALRRLAEKHYEPTQRI